MDREDKTYFPRRKPKIILVQPKPRYPVGLFGIGVFVFGCFGSYLYYLLFLKMHELRMKQVDAYERELANTVGWDHERFPLYAFKEEYKKKRIYNKINPKPQDPSETNSTTESKPQNKHESCH